MLPPADLDWPDGEVIGSEAVHHVFRGWLAGLGQDSYADEPAAATSSASPGASSSAATSGASSES